MDKQKQIDEMAKFICEYVQSKGLSNLSLISGKSSNPLFLKVSHNYGLAEWLYAKNYRKGETISYQAMIDAQNADRWKQGYEQGIKETVEKFSERLRSGHTVDEYDGEGVNHPYVIADYEELDEICKELTEDKV